MHVEIHPNAELELFEAAVHYESERAGLGIDSLDVIDKAKWRICEAPYAWPETVKGTRKFVVQEFPYVLQYRVQGTVILIVAVSHQKRRPGYWKDRI